MSVGRYTQSPGYEKLSQALGLRVVGIEDIGDRDGDGVTTGVGGIIRHTLGHLPSVLLGHEIYVTASVLGACVCVALDGLGAGRLAAMSAGFLVTFVVRVLAIAFGWSLPVFRPSAKRERWR